LALAALAGGPLRATLPQQPGAAREEEVRARQQNQRAREPEPNTREPEVRERQPETKTQARPEEHPAPRQESQPLAPRAEPERQNPRPEPQHLAPRAEPEHPESRAAPGHPGPKPAPGPQPKARVIVVPPETVVRTHNGGEIHRGPGGVLREVRTPSGAVIHYAPDGLRRVEVARPDGRVFVAAPNGRGGYVQRPYKAFGQPYFQRTVVTRGGASVMVYRPWVRQGVTYNVYLPCRYYRPAFYTWTCRPWPRPVHYPWGWAGRPWFGYYRGWYTPYPYYVSPIFWLTDFMVAVTLEDAYQARLDSEAAMAPPPPPTVGLTPDVRDAIADEVQRQVQQEQEQEQEQATNQGYPPPAGPPPLFSDNVSRIFMVYASVPAYLGGKEFFLSEGDVLQLRGAPPANAAYADVTVLASRTPACPKGSVVSVSLQDLQEMQNHMQATIDQGLGTLQAQQGQEGLPPVPAQNLGASNAPYAASIQPDPNAAAELAQVAQDASQSGQAVLSQAPATPATPPPPAPPTRSLTLGMGVDEVHSILGTPRQSASMGAKLIEVYPNFKVTYVNGRVTDIQ